ncbi:MAG: oxygen-independent coproporphyrinogen III oxidase [Pseudomonadota bacterium]
MSQQILFDAALIRRYDQNGPRYTFYPTVAQFHADISEADYRGWAGYSNEDPIPRPLSLYVHTPFCDTPCFYCPGGSALTQGRVRAADYLHNLCRELALQAPLFDRDRVVEQLHWGGGTAAFLTAAQCRELMQTTRRHFALRYDDGGEYCIDVDAHAVEHDKLTVLRNIGFNHVSIGLQVSEPGLLQAVSSSQCMELARATFRHARALGYRSINIDLMYGLPQQTAASFAQTLHQVIELQPDRIAVYDCAHLPDRFRPQQGSGRDALESSDIRLDILQRSIADLTEAGFVYIGMDHFARPEDELAVAQRNGTLHRNFQGYSTRVDCDLIGLGVAAIGRVCDNYIQNTRDLDRYSELLAAGRLPLERGLELEPDDLLRREIISRLLCDFRLDITALEASWRFDFARYFRHEYIELRRMQEDGLLSIDGKRLVVLPAGRLLVRNICMVFDRYLHGGGSHTTFSKVI